MSLTQLDDGGDGGDNDHAPVQVRDQPQQLVDRLQLDISLLTGLRIPKKSVIPSITHM